MFFHGKSKLEIIRESLEGNQDALDIFFEIQEALRLIYIDQHRALKWDHLGPDVARRTVRSLFEIGIMVDPENLDDLEEFEPKG